MRIPLDYYRILSVPVKATTEQLKQAYSDRLLQQPRHGYSDRAIKARQELIEHSYQVLSDLEQRSAYDAQFLVNMQPLKTSDSSEDSEASADSDTEVEVEDSATVALASPTIEIRPSQLIGALLIFHELGEYELVLTTGIDFYNSSGFVNSLPGEISFDTAKEDLILSLALAYLELGREQWHRREYENAAVSGQMGIDLLDRENLFPKIKEELELDLYRLRPYRVLELISQNPAQSKQRAKGFELLRSMSIQRQGIEGKGQDRSGLSFDQFLCFIQQLRTYLTSAEQQELFDDKSQHDSAIANYLAVYALLGRGFSLKKPELILRAARKLDALNELQDVCWEQSITALLLGHTEKAIRKLQSCTDKTKLEQVQQHSASDTDLLPGLCFYGEKWLQEDVVAQFSDLTAIQLTQSRTAQTRSLQGGGFLTLKEYFADRQVQSYLEKLTPPAVSNSVTNSPQKTPPQHAPQKQPVTAATAIMSLWRNIFSTEKSAPATSLSSDRALAGAATKTTSSTATIERDYPEVVSANGSNSYRPTAVSTDKNGKSNAKLGKPLSLPLQPQKKRAVPASVIKKARGKARKRPSRKKRPNGTTQIKGWLFILGWILGAGTLGFITIKLLFAPNTRTANQAQLAIALDQPAVQLPPKKIAPVAAKPELTFAEKSRQAIQTWLDSKSAAFGKEHQIDRLNNILAEPLLTTWSDRASAYKQGNFYREYEHKLTMRSATVDPSDGNKATIEAEVKEVAKHYQSGKLDASQSYNDNLLVRYQLVRQQDKWLIKNAEVLKTL